jgi:hypothetical protein
MEMYKQKSITKDRNYKNFYRRQINDEHLRKEHYQKYKYKQGDI